MNLRENEVLVDAFRKKELSLGGKPVLVLYAKAGDQKPSKYLPLKNIEQLHTQEESGKIAGLFTCQVESDTPVVCDIWEEGYSIEDFADRNGLINIFTPENLRLVVQNSEGEVWDVLTIAKKNNDVAIKSEDVLVMLVRVSERPYSAEPIPLTGAAGNSFNLNPKSGKYGR